MSTCLSSPFSLFFTFTLQPARRSAARVANPNANLPSTRNLVLRMGRPSLGNLRRARKAFAPLGDIWNGDGKVAANRNLPEKPFDRPDLRDGRVGKCTHVILNLGEIAGQVRIPHGDDRRLFRGMIE